MSSEYTSPLLTQGTTETFSIPIEHLDYGFIKKCTDVKHLEKILRVLRSCEEGYYPDLIAFCEKRVENLCPKSRALWKEKPAATASSFKQEEWQEISSDLKNWLTEMKQKENELKQDKTAVVIDESVNLTSVRHSNTSLLANKQSKYKIRPIPKKSPSVYTLFFRFDVEEECSNVDKDNTSKTIINKSLPRIEKNIDTTGMTDKEKTLIADREKDKGNEAFRAGDYEEAIAYYSRSILVLPTVVAYNNRAQAEIKLQDWHNALNDCEKVMELDPGNLKALLRRATAHKQLSNYRAAKVDTEMVLQTEPDNTIAKKLLTEVEKKLKDLEIKSVIKPKGKRILIQEEEDSDEKKEKINCGEGDRKHSVPVGGETTKETGEMGNVQKKFPGREGGPQTEEKHRKETENEKSKCGVFAKIRGDEANRQQEKPNVQTGKGDSLPPYVIQLKSEGNELFKNGQFGDAIPRYSQAIRELAESGIDSPEDLCILFSNRAACHLKDGNCTECIQDCTRALELQPFSLKPLLRRAIAHDSLERYQQAYVDYKTVLQIDRSVQIASDSVNRITRTLIDQDGPSWREKLPPIPAVPVSAQQHKYKVQILRMSRLVINYSQHNHQAISKENRFLSLKHEGNEFFKTAQYMEAVNKYSECLKLKSEECAIYTNRALCYLKLNEYEKAKHDCDSALQLESSNLKAFYRRALANKELKNYNAAINDLNKVLELDSSVVEAKNEIQNLTELLTQQKNETPNSEEKQRKFIQIQEVNDSDEEEMTENKNTSDLTRSSEGSASNGLNTEKGGSEKCFPLRPTNAYEFGQAINAVKTNANIAACADLLENINPQDLPTFMSNKLEGDVFIMIIQALEKHILEKDPNLVYQHLVHLCKSERFKVIFMLLNSDDKEVVQHLFDHLSKVQSDQFTTESIQILARSYYL
uniref:Sperm associated antigen 1 n=1 Tax=Latimeria chalumnae TaxID=7897 RepID=H3B7U3_LATCH